MRIRLTVSLLMYSADDAKIDSFHFIGSVLWDFLDLQPDITQKACWLQIKIQRERKGRLTRETQPSK